MNEGFSLTNNERTCRHLDQEVDAAGAERVEALLATDPQLRQEADLLRRSWDMLEFLDRPNASQDFTQRTASQASLGVEILPDTKLAPVERGRISAGVWFAGVAAAFLVGLVVALWWPSTDRQLLKDRQVLEKLDQFEAARSFEFLTLVHEANLPWPSEPPTNGRNAR